MKIKGYEYFFRESILISIEKERRREYGLKHPSKHSLKHLFK